MKIIESNKIMDEKAFLRRKILLKSQLIEITQKEITELKKRLKALKEKRKGDLNSE